MSILGIQGHFLEATGSFNFLIDYPSAKQHDLDLFLFDVCSCGLQQIEGHRMDLPTGSIRVSRVR